MWLDSMLVLFDKVRFVPVLNLVTLWCYAVDSLRWPGKAGRILKLFGAMIAGTLIAGIVAAILSWAPDWLKAIFMVTAVYGTVTGMICVIRDDVLTQRRLAAERCR